MDFSLSVFRFNPSSDYLPHYKKYKIDIHDDLKLSHLLAKVKSEDMFFEYPQGEKSYILLNKYAVCTDLSLKDLSKKFGFELILEPLSTKRSIKDLIIDSKDFDEVFGLLDGFKVSNKVDYDKYLHYFYTSYALKFDELHFGTSLFLYANELIEKHPEQKDKILKLIADEKHGLWYYYPHTHRVYPLLEGIDDIVSNLKSEILKTFPDLNKNLENIA